MMERQQIRDRLAQNVGGESAFAESYSNRTFRDLAERASRELDSGADDVIETMGRIDKALTAGGYDAMNLEGREALVARYVRLWSAFHHAGARTANWMVTGPARFPVARNEKAMKSEHRRYLELDAFTKSAPAKAVRLARMAHQRAIAAGGMASAELLDLRARLDKREAAHRRMKAVNEIIRRNKFKAGDGAALSAVITERGFPMNPNLCGMLLHKESWQAPGFQAYELTNNNAEIKRLRGRIAEVEAKAQRIADAGDEPTAREINGVRIVEDQADDRLRLFFPGKPAPAIISDLKGRGFRWSPTAGAWQRQLTQNARHAAECVVAKVA